LPGKNVKYFLELTKEKFGYCLYWWSAFARGYIFALMAFRDMKVSGIKFTGHDISNRAERFSPSVTANFPWHVSRPLEKEYSINHIIMRT